MWGLSGSLLKDAGVNGGVGPGGEIDGFDVCRGEFLQRFETFFEPGSGV